MTDFTACGGCGASNPKERCLGCFHDFGGNSTTPGSQRTPDVDQIVSDLSLIQGRFSLGSDDRYSMSMADANATQATVWEAIGALRKLAAKAESVR